MRQCRDGRSHPANHRPQSLSTPASKGLPERLTIVNLPTNAIMLRFCVRLRLAKTLESTGFRL